MTATAPVKAVSSTQSHDAVTQLRAKIAQMKEKLEAVKKDPKTDCKTKDWQMQSLQRAIAQTQQQVTAQTVQATKAEESAPVVAKADPNGTVNSQGSIGTKVSCYA